MSKQRRTAPLYDASTEALTPVPNIPTDRAGLTKNQSIRILQGIISAERRRNGKIMTLVLKTLDGVTNELVAARLAYFEQLKLQFKPSERK